MSLYEQEKYEQALNTVQEVLAIDEAQQNALELLNKIRKAKELADLIRAEEEQRRTDQKQEQEAGERPKPFQTPAASGEIWGEQAAARKEGEVELKIEEPPLRRARPVPGEKLVEQLQKVRVPVKPLLGFFGIATTILAAYLLYERFQSSAAEFSHSLLILTPVVAPADSQTEYLAYALADQLINRLVHVSNLRVIAPGSAVAARSSRGGAAAAARRLDVRYVADWSINASATGVTFDLSLLDTSISEPLWTSRRLSSVRELPNALTEIAQGILINIGLDGESGGETQIFSTMPDAYFTYLRGRYLMSEAGQFSGGEAAVAFRDALEIDGKFVPAMLGLAEALLREYDRSSDHAVSLLNDAAFQLKEVLASGYEGFDGFKVAGMVEQYKGRYDHALSYMRRTVELAPGDAGSYRLLSRLLLISGNLEEARRVARRAQELDPLNPESFTNLALVYQYSHELMPALQAYRSGMAVSSDRQQYGAKYLPELLVAIQYHDSAETLLRTDVAQSRDNYVGYYRLGRVLQAAGRPKSQWEGSFERARELILRNPGYRSDDPVTRSHLALVYTRLGRYRDATMEVEKALGSGGARTAVLYNVARVYAIQRDSVRATEFLEKAVKGYFDLDAILDMDFYNLRLAPNFLASLVQ
jgi:tetratricopeptide (TPR) repeat protein